MSVICLTFCTFAMHLGRKSKTMHSPLQREQSTTRGFVMEMNSLETQSSFSFCCTQLRPAGWLLTNRPKRNKNNKTKQNPRAWAATLGILKSFASFSKSTFQLYNYLKILNTLSLILQSHFLDILACILEKHGSLWVEITMTDIIVLSTSVSWHSLGEFYL